MWIRLLNEAQAAAEANRLRALDAKRAEYAERYISAALVLKDVPEIGANAGQMVELLQKSVGIHKGDPWCAAFVNYVGRQAFLNETDPKRSAWPLPMTGGCAAIGDFAAKHDLLRTEPQRGDVHLLYFPSMKRFAHTGIVLQPPLAPGGQCLVIDGNTNDGDGSREGYKVSLRRRTIDPKAGHRFVRWTELIQGE